ncbi:acetyl-CoA carboxylase carboxyltransferase subunit alpha [Akkermansiaceae bacterium]|nr:acetyl-CoA carboxylase carboxyltransferase subunit alpha [Akkermansiaceae bacterium]MDB4525301.1 acetyl-CoA carboxylase carboxyltransferase subunit alpha [Akkermansiaceae bacterium]MDB4547002.1 acetyl-CoA carboxylase carboxyltransferase subunit alpha [Akkermansiaceae bacterium]MDB4725276.1 acetyl-CoA carboxylase carboxyltransferase subunit alpha [Akkermansiaceae bacterium]
MELLEFEKPIAELESELAQLRDKSLSQKIDLSGEISSIEAKLVETRREIYENLSPWQRVQIARHTKRPFMLDYVAKAFDHFTELHGDRIVGDDHSMPGGFGTIDGHRCVVLGHQKGRDLKENLKRNFGSAHPEGYRKSLRLMQMAEKFSLPIVALIDTPGAFPGIGAEERNIAEAIARNLREMMLLNVPIIAVVLGEGGSGGALGIGVADRVLMMENAYYSVISPEGCAAILWKHRKFASEAAEAMKIAAPDLAKLGLIDGVIPEVPGGAHHDPDAAAQALRSEVSRQITELKELSTKGLLAQRYAKFRKFGEWSEA